MNKFLAGFLAGTGAAIAGAAGLSYLQGHRQVSRHVDRYAQHWNERPEQHPEGVLHYVALGDSAAQGVGASYVGASYVAILGERLAEATGRPVAITNLSVSGAVSGDVVTAQLPAFADLGIVPDVVTLDIGGNDVVFTANNTVESFSASFDAILQALPAGSFVGDVPWFMIPGWARRSRVMRERAEELIARHGHHLVPLYDAMRQTGYLKYHTNTAADWFHPNDKGHEGWADLFWEQIVRSGRLEELAERSA